MIEHITEPQVAQVKSQRSDRGLGKIKSRADPVGIPRFLN